MDALVLGSGHNSLVLTAYLAKLGLNVVCLEPKGEWGGGLATVELPSGSGYWHNIHSYFHRGITQAPWYRDLRLADRGVRYIEPELNVAVVAPDGQVLHWWRDFERTCESVARFSRRDCATLRRWREAFVPICQHILLPESQSPPLPHAERRKLLKATREGRLLLETSKLSPIEFVRREFEHPFVQASLLFFNGLREVDLYCKGMGHHVPALLASGRFAQTCEGGAKQLADGLVRACHDYGAQIWLNVTVRRIVVQHGAVLGVEIADGRFLPSRLVVSGLNPQQTFLQLLDAATLTAPWKAKSQRYQYNLVAPLFALHVNLSQPPQLNVQETYPEVAQALMVTMGVESLASLEQMVRHHRQGTVPEPVFWGSCPTQFDPRQAPMGKHTAFVWEKLPYSLQGDPNQWDRYRARHADQLLQTWMRYAPNVGSCLIDRFAFSPLDVERSLPNMWRGDLLVGSLAHGQVGSTRPFAGAGQYRTEISGLYLCGSCCHPGGNITGLPGYNCAQALAADLGLDLSWAPPSLRQSVGRLT